MDKWRNLLCQFMRPVRCTRTRPRSHAVHLRQLLVFHHGVPQPRVPRPAHGAHYLRQRMLCGCTLRLPLQKYTGKHGTITAKMGDRSWDVTFKGRTGGIASFDSSEIAVVADEGGEA